MSTFSLGGCVEEDPDDDVSASPSPDVSPGPEATPTVAPSSTPWETPLATPLNSPIPTPTETPVPTPEYSPFPTPTEVPFPTPTATPFPTPPVTPASTPDVTSVPTPADVPTPTLEPAGTPVPTLVPDTDLDDIPDDVDNCPEVANPDQADLDEDLLGDVCDPDRDGDDVSNADDDFPDDPLESADTDGDGVGDNADAFPDDPLESEDTDDDGVGDNRDNCAETANSSQDDLDDDGLGDVCDDDRDGDHVNNDTDVFPDNPVEWEDRDGDGVGDNSDAFPDDPTQSGDQDGDGTGDGLDNCPEVANPDQADLDGDKAGDVCDDDEDGDGHLEDDVFPRDPGEWADSDEDGTGDNSDAFPFDSSETADTDSEGTGDNADNCPLTANPDQADLDTDGRGDVCDPDADGDSFSRDTVGAGKDCDDQDAGIYPGAKERCDGVDNNCSGEVDEGVLVTYHLDADDDGYGSTGTTVQACTNPADYVSDGTDCDDSDSSIHPHATEVAGDNIDQDCDGAELCYTDLDSDGYRADSGATMVSADADCNDLGEAPVSMPGGDCRDSNDGVHPDAEEVCNKSDDNCDGQIDEGVTSTFYRDADGDLYGDAASQQQACRASSGYVSNSTDCDDSNATVHPGATEVCDGLDNDCDNGQAGGGIDEGALSTFYQDSDNDGYGFADVSTVACAAPAGYVDDDSDCNDSDSMQHPGADETCNNVDDDCDGQVDEGVKFTYYYDGDGDDYGSASGTTQACGLPSGYSTNNSDCDDKSAAVHPGGTEVANGVDDDCDGSIDEGVSFSTCKTAHAANPALSSGVYTIDPDGSSGGIAPYSVYCDMETSGGGWTIVSKLDSLSSTYGFGTVDAGTLGGTSWNTAIVGKLTYSEVLFKYGNQTTTATLAAPHTHTGSAQRLDTTVSGVYFQYIAKDHHGAIQHLCIGPLSTGYGSNDVCVKVYTHGTDNGQYGFGVGTAMNVTYDFDDRPGFFWNNTPITYSNGAVVSPPFEVGVR